MKIMNLKEKESTAERAKDAGIAPQYGTCIYCGQSIMLYPLQDDLPQEELDKMATEKCKCPDAERVKRERYSAEGAKNWCDGKLEMLMRSGYYNTFEDDKVSIRDGMSDLFDKIIETVQPGFVDKVTIDVGDHHISLKNLDGSIKVHWDKKNVDDDRF
jgi:hypothetical protein